MTEKLIIKDVMERAKVIHEKGNHCHFCGQICEGLATRIKELEAEKERLEAAFLETEFNLLTFTEDRNESALRKMAREALEKIRNGEKND